jgi:CBS domain-containing protein
MKLRDIMTPNVECVRPDDTLQEAARKMMALAVGPMPVCADGDKVVGMLTDRDIVVRATAEGKDPKHTRVREAMSGDVIGCYEDQDSEDAVKLMRERQVRRLLVMGRDARLVGIVSLADLATVGKPDQAGHALQAVSEPAEPRR